MATVRDAMAVVHVSSPVSNTLTHCSLPTSHTLIVLLLPPATSVPLGCIQDSTMPLPLESWATSGRATNADANDAPVLPASELL